MDVAKGETVADTLVPDDNVIVCVISTLKDGFTLILVEPVNTDVIDDDNEARDDDDTDTLGVIDAYSDNEDRGVYDSSADEEILDVFETFADVDTDGVIDFDRRADIDANED